MTVRRAVTEALDNARRHEKLCALITSTGDQALRDADRLDAGDNPGGPLHGVPVSLKDNIDLAGVPTTAGSVFLGEQPAARDATVAERLRDAGAVFVAKNNMAEWAMGVTTQNPTFGGCRNPWDPERIPGGSSGGSAVAVATGMSALSLGTDTGGSVRIPASVCGVTGLRPTAGRVSNRGVQPVSPSFDTVGPIARDVRLVAEAMAALDHYDELDSTSVAGPRIDVRSLLDTGVSELRVGVPEHYFFDGVDPGVRTRVHDAVEELTRLGASQRTVEVPGAELAQQHMIEIVYPEAAAFHASRMGDRPGDFDPDVLRRLRIGESTAPARTEDAHRWRTGFRSELNTLFHRVDIVVTPTIPIDVPRIADVDLAASTREIGRFTYAWAMYGGPSISLPCGPHPDSGMPVGLQLSAAPWHEHVLLHAAASYQRATRWHESRPPG